MRDSFADHIPDDLLSAYVADTLAEPDLAYVEEHLLVCEECRAGVAPALIREFLLQAAEQQFWTADYLRKILGVDAAVANQVLLALEASGYIEPVRGKRGSWRTTEAGNRMAGVSRAKPVLRKTLDQSLDALRDRIYRINHDPHFLYRIEKAVLFGPYVTGKQDRLKGLDLAIQLAPKEQDPARLEQLVQERAAEAERARKHFKSYADRMRFGESEVRDYLKSRSRAIVLHDLEEWIMREPHRVVWDG